MNLIRRLAGAQPHAQRSLVYETFSDALLGSTSTTGEVVTVDKALTLSAVWSAIRLLADTIGTLPMVVYVRKQGGGRQRAWYDPAYRLLHDAPNPIHTPADLFSLVVAHLQTHGNAYLGKEFSSTGELVALWPILPSRVRVRTAQNRRVVFYDVMDADGRTRTYDRGSVIHIKGFSTGGVVGLSPIEFARNTIGGALKRAETQDRLSANRAVPTGFLTTDGDLTAEQKATLKRDVVSTWSGPKNAGRIPILDNGMRFQAVSLPPDQTQFVEQMAWTVRDVARVFRVPPEKIGGDTGGSMTYSSTEWADIDLQKYSLRPWTVRIEQALAADADLFPTGALYPEALFEALLRADTRTRMESYKTALGGRPWMLPSEVRDAENLPQNDTFDQLPLPGAPLVEVKNP